MYGDFFSVATSVVTLANLYTGIKCFWSAPVIISCFTYDLVVGSPNKVHILHHLVSMSIMAIYFANMNTEDVFMEHGVGVILQTELSVPFYIFGPYLKQWPWLYAANNLAFLASFFWFRIVNMYFHLFRTVGFFHLISNVNSFSGAYILMGMNFYWAAKIVRIAFKRFDDPKYDALCHRIVSYMYFGNVGIVLYVNNWRPNYDVFGNMVLAVASYMYHQAAATSDFPQLLRVLDNAAIHLRCLIPMFVLMKPRVLVLFACNHFLTFVAYLMTENLHFTYFATAYDFVWWGVFSENPLVRTDVFTCLYLFALCILVEPMRRLSHVGTHALLWWVTYIIASESLLKERMETTPNHILCTYTTC
jgi:hypothetical protein